MNQKYYLAIAIIIVATNVMAESLGTSGINLAQNSTPNKEIEGKTAGGEKQTTIIDQNGNLKIIEQPSNTQIINTSTSPATTNMQANPKKGTQTPSATPPQTSVPGGTAMPAPGGTAVPAPNGTAMPAPNGTAMPAPNGTAMPAPNGTAVPAPAGTATPQTSISQPVPSTSP
jgi:hypothetical protein